MTTHSSLTSELLCQDRHLRRQAMAAPDQFHQGMKDECLPANGFLALPDRAFTLICLEGMLWLTRDGDYEDHILEAGQRFAVAAGDQATVQALRASRLRLVAA